MPLAYSITTGGKSSDGVQAYTLIEVLVQLPDTFPGSATVWGIVQAVTGAVVNANDLYRAVPGAGGIGGTVLAAVAFNGAVTMPVVPVSGSTYWCIQVDQVAGTLSTKTSATAIPTADAGNVVIFGHQIASTDTVPWMRAPTPPENWP